MIFHHHFYLSLLVLVLLGLAAPPTLHADCLLYASTLEDTQGMVIRMDDEANLSLIDSMTISYDVANIAVSPDGRVVVFAAGNSMSPNLTVCFVHESGSISASVYLNSIHQPVEGWNPYRATTFHATLPLFYTGWQPKTAIFRYDAKRETVESTGWSAYIEAGPANYGYSIYSGCLVCQTGLSFGADGMRTVRLQSDGSFGEMIPPLTLPAEATDDFALSSDGRWAAGVGRCDPELMLVAVHQDGTLTLADSVDFAYSDVQLSAWKSLCFSPDNRRLYLLSSGQRLLTCFGLDAQTGKLSELSSMDNSLVGAFPVNLTLSPDGRYGAFRSESNYVRGQYDINLVRLYEDGRMEYLPEKTATVNAPIADLAFGPIPIPLSNAAEPGWGLYE